MGLQSSWILEVTAACGSLEHPENSTLETGYSREMGALYLVAALVIIPAMTMLNAYLKICGTRQKLAFVFEIQ